MIAAKKAEPDNQISIERMCQLLDVSRSGYHAWAARQHGEPGPRARRRAHLAAKVIAAHEASDGTYGAPRVLAELRAGGEQVSRKTVAGIMADNKEKRTVAMTHDIYARLVTVAERERRSISAQIEVLIEEGLDHRDAEVRRATPRRGSAN